MVKPAKPLTKIALIAGATALALSACSGDTAPSDDGGNGEPVDKPVTIQFSGSWSSETAQAVGIKHVFDLVEERSEGSIKFEPFWEGSLVSATEALTGTGQGRADLTQMTILFDPGALPMSQLLTVPYVSTNAQAVTKALAEVYENNEEFKDEWEAQGVVPWFFIGVESQIGAGTTEVDGIDWLKGKKLRSLGLGADAVAAVGANPIGIDSNELYEALQRGTVDGYTTNIIDTQFNQRLYEVAPYIFDPGMGVYTFNVMIFNKDVWESLSDNQKKIFEEVAPEFLPVYAQANNDVEDAACDVMLEEGVSIKIFSEEDQKEWKEILGDSLLDKWKEDVTKAGKDADKFYEDFMTSFEKFEAESQYLNGAQRCAAKQ